jgi:hypothetical protein
MTSNFMDADLVTMLQQRVRDVLGELVD